MLFEFLYQYYVKCIAFSKKAPTKESSNKTETIEMKENYWSLFLCVMEGKIAREKNIF